MTVLAGFSATDRGQRALEAATAEARLRGTRLHIVRYVAHEIGDSFARAREEYEASEAAERELEALRARLSADGLEVTAQVLHGPLAGTAGALLGEAGRVGADLVVIGLSHRTPVGKLVMGSVAQEVLVRAECPVLTVKAPEDLRGR